MSNQFELEETKLFNLAVSGNTFLAPYYVIYLYWFGNNTRTKRMPSSHTCSQTLDIYYCSFSDPFTNFNSTIENYDKTPEFIEAKRSFVEMLFNVYSVGALYQM